MVLVPDLCRSSEGANQIKCGSNLRQIAMTCIIYAQANGGRFPDSVASLHEGSDLTAEVYNCPSSNAIRAQGPTTRATADLLRDSPPAGAPDCCQSYVYVGAGLTTAAPADAVLAYELPVNHAGAGGNVAFADARVEWHSAKSLNAIVAAAGAGRAAPPAAAATTRPAAPVR
ncbi:MAG: hypothetical protein JWO31_4185 [Phycisphaerales bacterium]|nr:hypothetical protein [Phycisphaerales bacterium]